MLFFVKKHLTECYIVFVIIHNIIKCNLTQRFYLLFISCKTGTILLDIILKKECQIKKKIV